MHAGDPQAQSAYTPQQALQVLKDGNARYVAGESVQGDLAAQRAGTTGGQWPLAVVLSCIDSRASAELILDQGIGDIFSVRLAGNVINGDALGSMEFACKVAGSKVLVVMGHTACGAVKGACDKVELGNLTGLLDRIQPAVEATKEPSDPAERTSANGDFVFAVTEANVHLTMAELKEKSPVLRDMVDHGEIALVGAMYDITSGVVTWYE